MATKTATTAKNGNGTSNGASGVDLADLDMLEFGDEPQPLDLIDPRDNTIVGAKAGKPARLYVLSYESETMVRYADELVNRTSKRGTTQTAEDNRERSTKLDARLLMAKPWENIEWKGQPLAHNLVNAQMLMTRLPWARRQVVTLASQEAAYLGNSSGSSASTEDTNSDSPSGPETAVTQSANG